MGGVAAGGYVGGSSTANGGSSGSTTGTDLPTPPSSPPADDASAAGKPNNNDNGNNSSIRSVMVSILAGQCIAFVAALTNITSFALQYEYGVRTHLFQLFWMYLSLLALTTFFACRRHRRRRCQHYYYKYRRRREKYPEKEEFEENCDASPYSVPSFLSDSRWWWCWFGSTRVPKTVYLGYSLLLDILPNYLTLLSLQYTTLTSTNLLLGSLTIPATMACSRIVFRKYGNRRLSSYTFRQYVGVAMCVLGGSLVVWIDSTVSEDTSNSISIVVDSTSTTAITKSFSSYFWGDVMALGAAVLYGVGDVVAEYCIKQSNESRGSSITDNSVSASTSDSSGPFEYLTMLGLFGTMWTGIACPLFERDEIRDLLFGPRDDTIMTWSIFVLYVCTVLVFYTSVSYFLIDSDATLMVLSLQTSNLWAVLFSAVAYRLAPAPLFYVAAVLVIGGVVLYQLSAPESVGDDIGAVIDGADYSSSDDGEENIVESDSAAAVEIESLPLIHNHCNYKAVG